MVERRVQLEMQVIQPIEANVIDISQLEKILEVLKL